MYEVLTGDKILLFETLDDAKICAEYIKGVVRDPETQDILADYYNVCPYTKEELQKMNEKLTRHESGNIKLQFEEVKALQDILNRYYEYL